jgi:hypothetical protein
MNVDYDIFEIVDVISDLWLVDARLVQLGYCTKHSQPLAPGYYVVNWPENIMERRFDERAAYHGPFKSGMEAESALDWMSRKRNRFLLMSAKEINGIVPESQRINGQMAGVSALKTKHVVNDKKSLENNFQNVGKRNSG